MSAPIITVGMLRKHGACSESLTLFIETFGESAKLTKRNWAKAITAGLPVSWTSRLLRAPARAEYDKVRYAAWAEYEKAFAPAQAEYNKLRYAAWAEYEKVRDAAVAEYEKACAPARAEYDKVRYAALYDALVGDLCGGKS